MNKIVSKVNDALVSAKNRVEVTRASVTMATAGFLLSTGLAQASAGEDLLALIIDIVGKGLIAGAVILAIMGIAKWASAHAEGDGPEMKKATNTLTAAIVMVIISAVIIANEAKFAAILTSAS